jgi:hypothetical protein
MSANQITNVEGMTAEEIARATAAGRLDDLLSGRDPLAEAKAEWRAAKDAADAELQAATQEAKPVDQGAMGGAREPKYDEAWLSTASPEAIAKALAEGKLTDLL